MSEPQIGDKFYATLLDEHATLDDVVPLLARIADALETIAGEQPHCDGINPETGDRCALGPAHVGYHVPEDGRTPWLDS